MQGNLFTETDQEHFRNNRTASMAWWAGLRVGDPIGEPLSNGQQEILVEKGIRTKRRAHQIKEQLGDKYHVIREPSWRTWAIVTYKEQ